MIDYRRAHPTAPDPSVILLAAVAVAVGALSQAVTGFGFSLVSAPFLIAALGAPEGVQVNLVLSIAINVVLAVAGRHHVAWRPAGSLLLPAAAASVAVGLLVRQTTDGALTVVAGLLCLGGVAAVASGRRWHRLGGPAGTVVVGATSGAMSVVAGIGGPPVVLFGVNAAWPAAVARPTMQVYFLGLNIVTLAVLGIPGTIPLPVVGALGLGLPAGWVLSTRLAPGHTRLAVLVVAALGSGLAVVRGLTG